MMCLTFLWFLMVSFLSFCIKDHLHRGFFFFFFHFKNICSVYQPETMLGRIFLPSWGFLEINLKVFILLHIWVGLKAAKVILNKKKITSLWDTFLCRFVWNSIYRSTLFWQIMCFHLPAAVTLSCNISGAKRCAFWNKSSL